ncbi:hypothetical protein MRY82_00275 [bacterium]|nr:hypothetical protein [bacterium]
MAIPNDVTACLKKLTAHGFEAYIVGGAVRDSLINKTTYDWDIACNANPQQLLSLFPKGIFKNKKYGTISIFKNPFSIEVTPYRIESDYDNHRHPKIVSFSKNLHDDLQRRDFTINAMAYDYIKHKLIDPFNGLKDLSAKQLNTVGLAKERLSEDYLRILRAARFATRLNLKIAKDIVDASKNLSTKITRISQERIGAEFLKIFEAKSSVTALDFCNQTQLTQSIFFQHTKVNSKAFSKVLSKDYQAVCRLLKVLNNNIDQTSKTIQQWSWQKIYQHKLKHLQLCLKYYQPSKKSLSLKHEFLLNLEPLRLDDWQQIYEFLYEGYESDYIKELKLMLKQQKLFAQSDLSINGEDIKNILQEPQYHQLIGKALHDLTEQVRLKKLTNNRQDLLRYIQKKYSVSVDKSS